ncbi:MAG: hypothetical protein WC878_06340 [Candidatus Paceibacterota bacterium]|jgi:hypothetical protein
MYYAGKENQRAIIMTLFQKTGGWKRYQIKAMKIALGAEKIFFNIMYPEDVVVLGRVEKSKIADIANETKFTSHPIIGNDNPRLHHVRPF